MYGIACMYWQLLQVGLQYSSCHAESKPETLQLRCLIQPPCKNTMVREQHLCVIGSSLTTASILIYFRVSKRKEMTSGPAAPPSKKSKEWVLEVSCHHSKPEKAESPAHAHLLPVRKLRNHLFTWAFVLRVFSYSGLMCPVAQKSRSEQLISGLGPRRSERLNSKREHQTHAAASTSTLTE